MNWTQQAEEGEKKGPFQRKHSASAQDNGHMAQLNKWLFTSRPELITRFKMDLDSQWRWCDFFWSLCSH